MKVVILGKGEMLTNLIEGTLDAKCELVGVFRYERTVLPSWILKFRDFFKNSNDVTIIKQHKLNEITAKSANSEEFRKEILKLNADIILVGTWKEKLEKATIDLPAIACVNVHPSYLPKYRGPNPYLQTILHRETKSGLTFHLMNEEFDKGAILSQKKIDILPNDTGKELKERTLFQARLMCAEILKNLEYGLIIPIEQQEKEATYYPNITPNDIMLDFNAESAEEIHARIRAFHPWLPCYITHNNRFFIPNPYRLRVLNEATVHKLANNKNYKSGEVITKNATKKSLTILCKDGKALQMDDIKLYRYPLLTKLFI